MAFDISTILGSNIGQIFKDAVGAFKADPSKVLEFQALIEQNKDVLAQKQIELQEKLEDSFQAGVNASSANIKSEEGSGDKWTQRARPTGLYVFYALLAFALIWFPIKTGHALVLPDLFWYTFISGYLGYGAYREVGKLMALPGESALKLPGLSISNKQ